MPVERCFDWESLTLARARRRGRRTRPTRYARRAEEDAAHLPLQLPAALAGRARAAVLLAPASRSRRLASRTRRPRPPARSERDSRQHSPAAWRGERSRRRASALEAIAALREAERELDACGSVRVRDEMRRELRKLGARAEPRGPAAAGDSGIDALTKRELEIAGLVTDRLTNREIAAALFLSDKTVESHLRNIFHKLGVSSRVDVARAVERERRRVCGRAGVTSLAPPRRSRRRAPGGARLHDRSCGAGLRVFDNAAIGFAAISPVVGLYAVVLVGTAVAGPAWVWVLPVALAGQCLLLAVYAELASEFPIAGGAYQWSRRLMGGTYGWLSGWVAICAYCAANTTIAYLGAPWALTLVGHRADAQRDRGRPGWSSSSSARSSARSASTSSGA